MGKIKLYKPTVYIICGFIGAGKTTFSRKLEKETSAIRITKDEWLVRIFGNSAPAREDYAEIDAKVTTLARDFAFQLIEKGVDVILDEGFWVKSQRDDMKKKILELGAKPILYYVECPVKKMRERTVDRSKILPEDSFEISKEMFDDYLKYWEPPEKDEEFILAK